MDLSGILGLQTRALLSVAAGILVSALLVGCGPEVTSSTALAFTQPASPTSETPATATSPALRPFVPTSTPEPSATATTAPPATMTPVPTSTATATATVAATDTPLAAATAVATEPALTGDQAPPADAETLLNGLPFSAIAVVPADVAAHVQAIYERGQELGRNPRAFSKMGDSLVLTDHYLTRFDKAGYNLGPFAALQPTVDHFAGSFSRYGVAAKVGLYADFATRPGLANGEWCSAEEHMLACEFRLHNPSIILIRIGTNDVVAASAFETALKRVVDYSIESGVVPVLGTKADRHEGSNRNNEIIRKVAADYRIPLWDFDLVAETLPDRGLSGDNAHLTVYKHDDFTDPATLQFGYPANDLSALVVLDALRALMPAP